MEKNRFMRIMVMFDLPTLTKTDLRIYRKYVKYLEKDGYIRVQYSIYSKLCINTDAVRTNIKRLKKHSPKHGDIRMMVITEKQYQKIEDFNSSKSVQEQITTVDRTVIIGGMNDETEE